MATFGNASIFGIGVTMSTIDRPRDRQLNQFFSINGLQFIDGGSRGKQTEVSGALIGSSLQALSNAESSFRAFADGIPRTLIDTSGNSWPSALLEKFQPIGRIRQTSQATYFRSYIAVFFHLI